MGRYLSWLGVLAGAISLFRLLHRAIAFDLSKPARIVVDFYSTFFHPIADFFKPIVAPVVLSVAQAWGLTDLPDWWREVFIVYALIGTALFRHSIEHPDAVDFEQNPFRTRARRARRERERESRRHRTGLGLDGPVERTEENEEQVGSSSRSGRVIALAATFAILWPFFPLVLFVVGLLNAVLFLRLAAYEEAHTREGRLYREAHESGRPPPDRPGRPDVPDPYRETTRWLKTHLYHWSLEMLKVVAATVVFMLANAADNS